MLNLIFFKIYLYLLKKLGHSVQDPYPDFLDPDPDPDFVPVGTGLRKKSTGRYGTYDPDSD